MRARAACPPGISQRVGGFRSDRLEPSLFRAGEQPVHETVVVRHWLALEQILARLESLDVEGLARRYAVALTQWRGQDELALAAKELDAQARPEGARVLFIGDLYAKSRVQMREILAKRGLPTNEDHAGIPDTSSLLYLQTQGQWVRNDKIALADPKTGVQGHPELASAELGKIYLDLKVDLAVKQIRSLLASSR